MSIFNLLFNPSVDSFSKSFSSEIFLLELTNLGNTGLVSLRQYEHLFSYINRIFNSLRQITKNGDHFIRTF